MRCCRGVRVVPEEEDEATKLSKMPPGPRAQAIIASGCLRLLSAVWILTQAEGYLLKRMQDLPKEAHLPDDHAAELFGESGAVIVISYGWLSKAHPDPTGHHMRAVQKYLKKHMAMSSHRDCGVFWDFASLPQRGPDGTMTEAEKKVFKKGLGAINLLYGYPKTIVIMLTRMPEELHLAEGEVVNLTPYSMRGWCYFELTVSGLLKHSQCFLNLGTGEDALNDEESDWNAVQEASSVHRQPPLIPEVMAVELGKKKFTNGSDTELVNRIYSEFFSEAAASVEELNLQNWSSDEGWGDTELTQLAQALPSFTRCKTLQLLGHGALGESGLAALRVALPKCPALREIWIPEHLRDTEEGQALSQEAAARGWLPWQRLEVCWG